MPVDLQLDPALGSAPDVSKTALDEALTALLVLTGDERLQRDLCVRICGAAESQALNADYRGKDRPTNVLSFAADPDLPRELASLGDVAICWPVVIAEARDQGKTTLDHFTHLYVHGVLHLLGFDHESAAQAEEMESLEVRVLAELGVADPYDPCK